jgi:hypothetical protein
MKTVDLRKQWKHLYSPSAKAIEVIEVPALQFAMIDGAIETGKSPGISPGFQEATQSIYSIAYTLKFMLKKRKTNAVDYPVMALEGLWWVKNGIFDIAVQDNWLYTLMMLQPDVVTQDVFEAGLAEVRRKRGETASLARLRLSKFEEGLCTQVMHIGPYSAEPATVARMTAFAVENGYRDLIGRGGKHHEIYLGDPRQADPAKLKTILRHPIEKRSK